MPDFSNPETLSSQERQQEIINLRLRRLTTGDLSDEELRYAVRLLRAERVARAGSGPRGTKQKANQASQTLSLDDF